ncbi:MAG: TAXI family TRAP transporter solute-binding subunit [Hyphomicrobiaceae bacterium]
MPAVQLRELLWIGVPAMALVLGAFWLAYQFVEPAPPRRIAITTGGETGAYYRFGKRYSEILARSSVSLEVRSSKGSIENLARLREASSGTQLALMQGGIANEATAPGLVSLGRVFLEPLWVFHRIDGPLDRLTGLAGKRIAIGPEGSGTRVLAEALLAANGIGAGRATFLPLGGQAAADALAAGTLDAVFLTLAPEAPLIQKLLGTPTLRLMNFAQAEAYARRMPYLSHVVLPMGAIDLAANVPARDIHLVAPMAAVVAREDLHPALIGLMVQALQEVHRAGGMFQRAGEFPRMFDPEFPVAEDAERVYKQGPPFFQRFLPFWLATFIERMAVMALPFITVLYPLVKLVPMGYDWRVRGRIFYWYGKLKTLERAIDADVGNYERRRHLAQVRTIEQEVAKIPVPVFYSVDYYDLRAAIDLVRQRIETRQATHAR